MGCQHGGAPSARQADRLHIVQQSFISLMLLTHLLLHLAQQMHQQLYVCLSPLAELQP
jgi:hypothetical protein